MDPKTAEFLVFTVFNAACLAAGYAARRRGWVKEAFSRRLHFFTVSGAWALVSLLSVWAMPMRAQGLWILAVVPATMIGGAMLSIPIAKAAGCSRQAVGVIAISSGLGNLGFACGAYLCYCLLEPRAEALAYGIAIVTVMQIAAVPIIYPIARRYGEHHDDDVPFARLVVDSFLDLRAMALYAAIAGLALAALGAPPPWWVWESGTMTVLFYIGAFGAFFGIGMSVRLGDARRYLKEHIILAGIKFIAFPLMTLLLLALIDLTPLPLDELLYDVFVIEAFMPTALLAVMISNLFHLDIRMASMVWLWNSVLFIIGPLPVILWWLS